MKLLLDENVPRPMAEIVRILLKGHEVAHVHDLKGWAGTRSRRAIRRSSSKPLAYGGKAYTGP